MWPHSRRLYAGRNPAKAVGIADLQAMAWRRLPPFVCEYLEGGAEDELTLRANRQSFKDHGFVPRSLTGAADPDPSIELFDHSRPLPFLFAPTGFAGLLWRDGDHHLARAAAAAGIPFVQSTASNASLEEVAATARLEHWFQLYLFRERRVVEALVDRCAAAGCQALVVTVDSATYGKREWDSRCYDGPGQLNWRRRIETLGYPAWLSGFVRSGSPRFGNLETFLPSGASFMEQASWARQQINPQVSWQDVAWLRRRWAGRLVLKGLSSPLDVVEAGRIGADAVVLSNHGGRQLDGAMPPLALLAAAARRPKGGPAILIDGGIRRGSDIVKAIALGADAVLVGRSLLYGLAAGGFDGVRRAVDILDDEVRRTMTLLGISRLHDVGPDFLRPMSRR